ncbi:O-antigen ligase family protein [Streptomyces bathyalis]|uniref:O-antigen ligase family protein n=1 Tax=Streptomyces bathyalis TaxID=2710756 RepID=A0A7T1WS43_9ACTN|nr:O-antigen ligase family protein [Streptomyces bathyalis]QPP07136.1 O-antigen ligase family protein [Streptomyces bathyalis]
MVPAVATVLILCVPVQTGDVTTSGKITAADAASLVLVVWCLVRLLRGRGGRLTPTAASVLGAPAVAFAVATAASADPMASLPGFVRYLQIFVLVPGALLLLLRGTRDFRLLSWALILLALVQGAVGVVQNLTRTGASYMGQDVRAVGTFGPLDVMGMSTVVSLGLVTAFALGLADRRAISRRQRVTAMWCAAALVPPLGLSYSRGAWIATAVACVVVLLLAGVRRAALILLALAAASVVLVGGFGVGSSMVQERLTSITDISAAPDRSVTDRYSLWSAATAMWQDDPATGVGLKNFPAHRDGHASLGLSSGSDTAGAGMQFQKEPLLSPHNMYLLVLSEQGLIGAVAVVGSGGVLLVCGLRRLHAARRAHFGGGPADAPGAADCGLAAVGLLVWQGVDFLYADIGGPSTVLTAVLLGTVAWWALAPSPAAAAPLPNSPATSADDKAEASAR